MQLSPDWLVFTNLNIRKNRTVSQNRDKGDKGETMKLTKEFGIIRPKMTQLSHNGQGDYRVYWSTVIGAYGGFVALLRIWKP